MLNKIENVNIEDNGEEKDLLNILINPDFSQKVSAFIRLVSLYKKTDENDIVYTFLESFEYLNNEKTNLLLGAIYNFLISDESSYKKINSWDLRIEKIYKNEIIMEKLIEMCSFKKVQTNLFVLLNVLFASNPCQSKWLESIVKAFYDTKRLIIERLSAKIIIFSLESEIELSLDEFLMIKNKILNINVNDLANKKGNEHLVKLSEKLKIDSLNFEFYFNHLKQSKIEKIICFATLSFLNTIKDDLTKRSEEIAFILCKEIESKESKIHLVLQHFGDLLDTCVDLRDAASKVIAIERLFKLTESEDRNVSYLSTLILNRIFKPELSD